MPKKSKNDLIIMRNSRKKNCTILRFPRKKKSKSNLFQVEKVEKILDNKAAKKPRYTKKILKTHLLSTLKFEKVTDNEARFE